MLRQLTEEGVIKRRETDGRYEITPQGEEELDWPSRMRQVGPRSIEQVIEELSSYTSYLEDLARSKDARLLEKAEQIRELGKRLTEIGGKS